MGGSNYPPKAPPDRLEPSRAAAQAGATAAGATDVARSHRSQSASGTMPKAQAAGEARQLLDVLPDGLAVATNQHLLYANPALVEMLEYASAEELTALAPLGFLAAHTAAESKQEAMDLLSTVLRGQATGAKDKLPLLTRQRRQIFAHLSYDAVTFEGARAILICIRDFTASHDAQKRLGHTDRMASIGSLAAGVAHEINNPLAYITTNIAYSVERIRYMEELLSDSASVKLDSPRYLRGLLGPISQALAEAHQGTEKAGKLVRDLRTLTQGDGAFVPVDLGAAVESAIHMSQSEYRYRARVNSNLGDLGRVFGNETRLVQLFLNLIVNAAQSFKEDSPETNVIVIRASQQNDQVRIEISDNGRGIPEVSLARVFEPFFTTRPAGQGTGLGLTICQSLAASMDGSLKLESTPDGTRVIVTLPSAASERPVKPLRPPSLYPSRRARVLIVDNEPLIIRAVSRLLAGEHDIESAGNGVEGLQMLRYEGPFDVIVCDLMMPEMNGMELYRRVREEMPEIARRFVFLTGGAFTDQAANFLREIDCPTLDKPIQAELLRNVVGGVLEG